MPTVHCLGCDRDTNSALAHLPDPVHGQPWGDKAEWCYASWSEEAHTFVKGCGYDRPDAVDWLKKFSDRYIGADYHAAPPGKGVH
jgi:hypothetical protein